MHGDKSGELSDRGGVITELLLGTGTLLELFEVLLFGRVDEAEEEVLDVVIIFQWTCMYV